jgi:hypothetical protein
MFVRLTVSGAIYDFFALIDEEDWAALAPELLWPIWGVALGAATLAYYFRRRGEHIPAGAASPGGNERATAHR